MYRVITGAGFVDTWAELRPGVLGFTCCHLPDLSNQVEAFYERIDYVLTSGLSETDENLLAKITRIGDEPSSLVSGPVHRVWPSDHAGLFAEFRVPATVGLVE
jgi:hypothetical protein